MEQIHANVSITYGTSKPNAALLTIQHDDIVVIEMDFDEKYVKIVCVGSDGDIPMMVISSPSSKEETEIQFTDFEHWHVLCYGGSRYSIVVTLVSPGYYE